jgi:8-oxo-dGTP pyrophosphatase MutT (NUDIX family)
LKNSHDEIGFGDKIRYDVGIMILQVGVKILLENLEGNFLLLHRNPEKYKDIRGTWDIVGGRINPGATLMENLRREVKEETKLEIIGEPTLLHAQDILRGDPPEKHVVRLTYRGKTNGEPILDTEENDDYRWVTWGELKTYDDLDIYVKEILEKGIAE